MTATPRRELSELIVADSMVWDNIQEWARLGVNTILPITRDYGQSQLLDLQMTTLSSFGALTLHCGGILADHGWLKLFGGGTDDMPSLGSFISGIEEGRGAGLCGIDVLGGVFAVNWGAFPGEHHRLWYWAPDLLDWQRCDDWKHIDLLWAALTGAMNQFYDNLRWPGWQDDVARLAVDEGIALTPEPFTAQGHDPSRAHKSVVPMAEICRAMHALTAPGGLFAATSPRYPMYWGKGRHTRPDIDRFITAEDLLDVEEPLWPDLHRLVAAGPHRVLPPDPEVAHRRFIHLECGANTGIGAMVYHCAGLLVDHGWLRLFGSGSDSEDSRDLVRGLGRGQAWLVGYDVLGGTYAMNLGTFENVTFGHMMHWSTATARWHPMNLTYEEFLRWALTGGLNAYYHQLRWTGWESVVASLSLDEGIMNRAPTPMSSIVDHWTNIGTPDPYPMAWPLDDHQPS